MQNPYLKKAEEKMQDGIENIPFIPEIDTNGFLKGLLIGAGITYIMTNEKAQQALFKAIVKTGTFFQAGVEELKERFEDAKAEIQSQE